ncbi:hypothetical protein H3Z83_03785 [Tenacibaculum sp. S7007]|uniref:Uncharacterized protein n=1 Tax=Tenacibaculum pelagium TaxID=2759527 RepID=A0A839AKL4_9FLAO|nr:hypothetical protein [Tenacibaculum pelagium]MBA6155643.1 hypothetical protein [Tenacibaculum pelagium]
MLENISSLGTVLCKTEQEIINGGGYGKVTCADGSSFSATAESMDSVVTGGDRWCRDRGGASNYLYVGELQ